MHYLAKHPLHQLKLLLTMRSSNPTVCFVFPQACETQAITFENQYSDSEKSSVWTTKGIKFGFEKKSKQLKDKARILK